MKVIMSKRISVHGCKIKLMNYPYWWLVLIKSQVSKIVWDTTIKCEVVLSAPH